MALKFLDSGGSGLLSDAVNAIEFAIQAKAFFAASNGANVRVLSNSWGGTAMSPSLTGEIQKAATNGMLFVAAAATTADRFQGPLQYPTKPYQAVPPPYLVFPPGVYSVDYRRRTIRTLFGPTAGQTVMWAIPWKDEDKKTKFIFVVTDKSVHVLDDVGAPVFSAPLAHDLENYGSIRFGRLENPERFIVWYEPSWFLRTGNN